MFSQSNVLLSRVCLKCHYCKPSSHSAVFECKIIYMYVVSWVIVLFYFVMGRFMDHEAKFSMPGAIEAWY